MSYNENLTRYYSRMQAAGFTWSQADDIRRDAERIDTWNTHECNGTIQWAEEGQLDHRKRKLKAGRPYTVTGQDDPHAPCGGRWSLTSDRYNPARERIEAAAATQGLAVRWQGDPRGWPVYIVIDERNEIGAPIRDNKRY